MWIYGDLCIHIQWLCVIVRSYVGNEHPGKPFFLLRKLLETNLYNLISIHIYFYIKTIYMLSALHEITKTVEHGTNNTKVMGWIPKGKHKTDKMHPLNAQEVALEYKPNACAEC